MSFSARKYAWRTDMRQIYPRLNTQRRQRVSAQPNRPLSRDHEVIVLRLFTTYFNRCALCALTAQKADYSMMSDSVFVNEDDSRSQQKKRRNQGACDICKRRKIRCDSGLKPGNRCSNCVQYGFECTHKEVTKTLGPAKGYVESLEARLEKMDRLISKLMPGVDINQEMNKLDMQDFEPDILPRNDDDVASPMLAVHLSKLSLNPSGNRFFGKSSGYQLVQTALDLKQEYAGTKWNGKPFKRAEYWTIPPWAGYDPELDEEMPDYIFPDEDLIPSLIDNYFETVNIFWPLLHRPTFKKQVAENLHRTNGMFGAILLLVCAHGARFSDDPRALVEGSTSLRSAGWQWFQQVSPIRKSLYKQTTLLEIQMHALYISWAESSEMPQGLWAQLGLATRFAQEVGAHRRRRKNGVPPTAEDELWKRAFWVLLCLDRNAGAHAGRPCSLQDEDLDLDLPLECDDEYWEHGFEQPVDKPSSIAFFNAYLGLMEILAHAMRLIYPIKHPNRRFLHSGALSDQQVIVELDSAMNQWMDAIPQHLKWNPKCEDKLFLKQSSALYATYYYLQIFIHRPFIPSPRQPKPVSFPSLAICTNAARSCCHVLEVFSEMSPLPLAEFHNLTFLAAIVLLLNIWSGQRTGYAPHPKREMEDVQRCMDILECAEKRFAKPGRFRDVLKEIASAGEVSLPTSDAPAQSSSSNRKRTRGTDTEAPSQAEETETHPTLNHPACNLPQRNIASNRRVPASSQTTHPEPAPFNLFPSVQSAEPATFSLPMYGNELGRLPVYGQFSFSDSLGTTTTTSPSPSASTRQDYSHQPSPAGGSTLPSSNFIHNNEQGPSHLPNSPVWGTTPDSYHFYSGNFTSTSPESNSTSTPESSGSGATNTTGFSSIPSNLSAGEFDLDAFLQACGVEGGGSNGVGVNTTYDSKIASNMTLNAHMNHENTNSGLDGNDNSNPEWSESSTGLNIPNIDDDTLSVWSTAPTNLELDAWHSYISNVEQLTHAQNHSWPSSNFEF